MILWLLAEEDPRLALRGRAREDERSAESFL